MTDDDTTTADVEGEQTTDDLQRRLDAIERTVARQRERIAEMAEASEDDGPLVSRRSVLTTTGVLGLLGLGAGSASADPEGQIGTSSNPLNKLYTTEINSDSNGLTVNTGSSDRQILDLGTPTSGVNIRGVTGEAGGNVVAGHPANEVKNGASGVTISGGGAASIYNNIAGGDGAVVGGGARNEATGDLSTVAGGYFNSATGLLATIPGGEENTADAENSFAAGRSADTNGNNGAFVWGDSSSSAATATATDEVRFQATGGFVITNRNDANESVTFDNGLPSGSGDTVVIDGSGQLKTTTGGGSSSKLETSGNGDTAFQVVDGGTEVTNASSTITSPNVVGGHPNNNTTGGVFSAEGAVIAGGGTDPNPNTASGKLSTVSGGRGHTASGENSTVGGGSQNTATADETTVCGGRVNDATAQRSTIGGGDGNTASGEFSTIAGGENNTAGGNYSVVPGGRRSAAESANSFVFNDGTKHDNVPNALDKGLSSDTAVDGEGVTGPNTFSASAQNGFRFITGGSSSPSVVTVDDDGSDARLQTHSYGLNIKTNDNGNLTLDPGSNNELSLSNPNTTSSDDSLLAIDGSGNVKKASSTSLGDVGGVGSSISVDNISDDGSGSVTMSSDLELGGNALKSSVFEVQTQHGPSSYSRVLELGAKTAASIRGDTGSPTSLNIAGNVVAGHPNNEVQNDADGVVISGGGGDSGFKNIVGQNGGVVGGGVGNEAGEELATVAGGQNNAATGILSTIPGGEENTADGKHSFAAGRKADTNTNDGAFVWGDSSSTAVTAGATDEVRFQASGGFVVENGNVDAQGGTVENTTGGLTLSTSSNDLTLSPSGNVKLDSLASLDVDGNDITSTGGYTIEVTGTDNDLILDANNQVKLRTDLDFDFNHDIFANGTKAIGFDDGGVVSLPNIGTGSNNSLHIKSDGTIVEKTSSARFKTNIRDLSASTDRVLDLQPRTYEREDSGGQETGLIAEEVDEILPEIVTYDEDGAPYGVQYQNLGVFLVPEVDENRERITDIEDETSDLEADIDAKDARIADQEDRIERLESKVDNKDVALDALRDALDDRDERIDDLEAESAALREENEQLRERNAELEDRLATVEAELGIDATASQQGVADD